MQYLVALVERSLSELIDIHVGTFEVVGSGRRFGMGLS